MKVKFDMSNGHYGYVYGLYIYSKDFIFQYFDECFYMLAIIMKNKRLV